MSVITVKPYILKKSGVLVNSYCRQYYRHQGIQLVTLSEGDGMAWWYINYHYLILYALKFLKTYMDQVRSFASIFVE